MQKNELEKYELSDCLLWNEENSAFIKHDQKDNIWLICDAMGEKLASVASREEAFIIARQNELEPCSVH